MIINDIPWNAYSNYCSIITLSYIISIKNLYTCQGNMNKMVAMAIGRLCLNVGADVLKYNKKLKNNL